MDEDGMNYREEEAISETASRFRNMVLNNRAGYFDVLEFEDVIDFFLDDGNIGLANKAVEAGLSIHPSSVALQIKKANILLIEEKSEECLEFIELAMLVESNNHEVYFIKGSAITMMGDITLALELFELAISYCTHNVDELMYNISGALSYAGESQKALSFLERAFAVNPRNELVLYELGYLHDKNRDFAKSVNFYNLYLDIDPFNASAWYNLGIIYNKNGKYEEAINAYDFSIALQENFAQSWFNMANVLSYQNKYEEAIKCYNKYIEFDDSNEDAYCYLGECHLNLEHHEEALGSYEKALSMNRHNSNALYGAGLVMWMTDRLDNASSFLEKALKSDQYNPEFWSVYGKISIELENFKKAENAFKKATTLDPHNPESWVWYAEMKHKQGHLPQAINILKKANRIIDKDPDINYRLTAYLLQNNDEHSATGYFEKALELDLNGCKVFLDYYPEAVHNESINRLIKKHTSTKL